MTPKVWGRMHVVGDFVVQAYLKGDTSGPGGVARRYIGEIGAKVDSLIVIGRGEVEVILYDYVSDACESLQIRASKFAQCETLEIVELDYDWGDLCAWHRNMSGEVGFDEHKYQQSRGCVGCEDYQEGCTGLPVYEEAPLPGLCSDPEEGWESFCVSYLNAENLDGTCARLECDCDSNALGIGGEACDVTCPVPEGIPEPSPCGEDQGWGRCVPTNVAAVGMRIGECQCTKTHMNPVLGCSASCNATGQCSEDVDTPMSVNLPECDFEHLVSVDVPSGAVASTSDGDRPFSIMYADGTLSDGASNFTGVSLVDVTCNVLLPDSVCSVVRGRCVCAPPFTAETSVGLTHFNPNGDYRVALMQGTDMVQYVPFLTYAPPMVVDVRFSGFSYRGCPVCIGFRVLLVVRKASTRVLHPIRGGYV